MRFFFLVLLLLSLVACGPIAPVEPLPTETPQPTATTTPTSTATIVWFPPTATPTPYPTRVISPTVEMRPDLGEVILSDDFSSAAAWKLSSSDAGTVALGKKELTIVINQAKTMLFSLRQQPDLGNFYAEIKADLTFCSGVDEYGLLLRANGPANYYRFSLSCDGQVRLDRVLGGEASSPQPWSLSESVPPGAPSSSTLGVWASGDEMRFFVNGDYQFTIHDPSLSSGTLGVFARTGSSDQVTVGFSNLIVRKIK